MVINIFSLSFIVIVIVIVNRMPTIVKHAPTIWNVINERVLKFVNNTLTVSILFNNYGCNKNVNAEKCSTHIEINTLSRLSKCCNEWVISWPTRQFFCECGVDLKLHNNHCHHANFVIIHPSLNNNPNLEKKILQYWTVLTMGLYSWQPHISHFKVAVRGCWNLPLFTTHNCR